MFFCPLMFADCDGNGGSTQLVEETGTLVSPQYPNDYENDLECLWYILLPNNKYPRIVFLDFLLEDSYDCVDDYVKVSNCIYTNVYI